MSLEEDIYQAILETLDQRQEVTSFVGVVQSDIPLRVNQDGASVAIPCVRALSVTPVIGDRVAVTKYGNQFVVMCVLAA